MSIYFDNNATTPLDPEVLTAMLPYLKESFGNPSSGHTMGEVAKSGIEKARRQVAELLNCNPTRLFFTSCGSESNNIAIFSAITSQPGKKHIISSQVEHASVLEPLKHLQMQGYEIELLPVSESGAIDLERLSQAIRQDTALVSIMAANNETGVLLPIDEIGTICKEKGTLFHSDAVQMVGKEPIDLANLKIDYLSMSGHKIHASKGSGALYAARTAPVLPLFFGGGQEKGKRSGTENVPGIIGFGKACELAGQVLQDFKVTVGTLRDFLEKEIHDNIRDSKVNGAGQARLVNTINISFKSCSAAALIQELDMKGIAISAHSACHSGDLDPSHVLTAMDIPEEYLHGTVRISLSRMNTSEEVTALLKVLPKVVEKSRAGLAL